MMSVVVNMERTNVRYLEAESLGELVDAATIDGGIYFFGYGAAGST